MEVIDDFFDNPYDIRNTALKCDWQTVNIAYPGIRKRVPAEIAAFTLKTNRKKV